MNLLCPFTRPLLELCVHFVRVFTGAIFTEEQKDSSTELAFKYAVYRINKDKTVLPKTTLVYDIQYVPKDDSFRTAKIGKYLSPPCCSSRICSVFSGH